jgi:membrane protease subunit HflK
VLKSSNKIIMDGQQQGAVPYLPLNEMMRNPAAQPQGGSR